jgi:uncharacterized protein RhaS with RHS repeats
MKFLCKFRLFRWLKCCKTPKKEILKMPRTQHSQERQRGYQLVDSSGKAVSDENGNLVFEIVYENAPEPTSTPQPDQKWVKMWDNDLKHTTTVTPHIEMTDAGTVADPGTPA